MQMTRRISRRSVSGGSPEDLSNDAQKSPVIVPATSATDLLGENIGLSKSTDLQEQLDGLRDQFVKAMSKQQGQNVKYTAVQSLNKQLSSSYFKNLQVIIDVSKLLSSYVEFLDIVKSQTSQLQVEMDKLGPSDFDYVKNLTTEKIFSLSDEFKKSAAELKALYMQYNMKDEIDKIKFAEDEFKNTIQLANDTYNKLSDGASPLSDRPSAPSKPLEEQTSSNASNSKKSNTNSNRKNAPKSSNSNSKPNTSPSPKQDTSSEKKPDTNRHSGPVYRPTPAIAGPKSSATSSEGAPKFTPSSTKPPTSSSPSPATPGTKPDTNKTVATSEFVPMKFGKRPLSNTKKTFQK
jgi:hypothetical protein